MGSWKALCIYIKQTNKQIKKICTCTLHWHAVIVYKVFIILR